MFGGQRRVSAGRGQRDAEGRIIIAQKGEDFSHKMIEVLPDREYRQEFKARPAKKNSPSNASRMFEADIRIWTISSIRAHPPGTESGRGTGIQSDDGDPDGRGRLSKANDDQMGCAA